MVSKDELVHLSEISKIDLSRDEIEKFLKQIDKTIQYINVLEGLSSDDLDILDLSEIKFDDLREDINKMFDGKVINKNLTDDGYLKGSKMT